MPLDTANFLAGIVAFFHGCIRVLRINNQESGFFMAPAGDVLLPPDFLTLP